MGELPDKFANSLRASGFGWRNPATRTKIETNAARDYANRLRRTDCRNKGKPKFPQIGEGAFRMFQENREKGQKVSGRWICRLSIEAAKKLGNTDLKASRNWRWRWCIRNRISFRKRSNTKKGPIAVHLPAIKTWHATFRRGVVVGGLQLPLPVFGRFPLARRLNADQVLLSFVSGLDYTYSAKDERRVHVAQCDTSGSRRMATMHVLFSPMGPCPKPAPIFAGAGHVSKMELDAYSPDVDVYWQKKAWFDKDATAAWGKKTFKKFGDKEYPHNPDTPGSKGVPLKCDNLRPKLLPAFRRSVGKKVPLWARAWASTSSGTAPHPSPPGPTAWPRESRISIGGPMATSRRASDAPS